MMGLLLICIFTFATSVGTLVIVYRMMDHIKILEGVLLQLLKPNYQDVEDLLNKEKDGRSEQKNLRYEQFHVDAASSQVCF